ncbi:MAG: hypothetical protein QM765_17650 [Myxococcales bacterium]
MRNLIAASACLIALLATGSATAAEKRATTHKKAATDSPAAALPGLDLTEASAPAPAPATVPAGAPETSTTAEPAGPTDSTAAAPTAEPAATALQAKDEWAISDRGALLAGVKAGGFVSYTALRPNARVTAELGYVLPFLSGMFAIQAELGYAEPRKFGVQSDDPRVPGGAYHYTLVQQQLTVMPTVVVRLPMLGRFVPYLGVGARIYLLQSTTRGEVSGAEILSTKEQDAKVGVGIPIGVQIGLGPGHLTIELLTEWGPLEHTATGPSNTGAESLQVGYRFLL